MLSEQRRGLLLLPLLFVSMGADCGTELDACPSPYVSCQYDGIHLVDCDHTDAATICTGDFECLDDRGDLVSAGEDGVCALLEPLDGGLDRDAGCGVDDAGCIDDGGIEDAGPIDDGGDGTGGTPDVDGGQLDPDAGQLDPDAGQLDPDAGQLDPDGGEVDGGSGDEPTITAVDPDGTVGRGGEEITFGATASGAPTGWSWDFGGGTTVDTSTSESPRVTLGAPGEYTGSVTASNEHGSSAAFEFTYTVAAAVAAPSITSLYVPLSAQSGSQTQVSAIVSGAPTAYAWSFGGGATPNISTSASPTITFGQPGTYTVSLTVSNAGGSSAPSTMQYTVVSAQADPPLISAVSQTGYLGATGGMINFNATASNASGATWTWDFGSGATLYGLSEQFTAITLGDPGVHDGSVTATTSAGSHTLEFTFLVTASPVQPPTFQIFGLVSSPLPSLAPRTILLADGRPLVAYATAVNEVAVSVSGTAAPTGASSFAVHTVDATALAAPRALAAALVGGRPALAYLYPDVDDLVLAVSIGAAAPTQITDWSRHEVTRLVGAAASTAADVELTVASGVLALAVLTDAGLQMAYADNALPTTSADWALHVLDASSTLRDSALSVQDGVVVAYVDAAGVLRFASAATDPPTQTSDWSAHTIESYAGLSHVGVTVMSSSVVVSATGTSVFGVERVHRSLVGNPTGAASWETDQVSPAFGRHAITTLDGRLALVGMTSTTSGVPYAMRTVLPDVILLDAWQYRQLSGLVTNAQMGDAIGLASGRLAFAFVDATGNGSVVFAQADAAW